MAEANYRIPPNDLEAEKAVLGSVMIDNDRLIEIREMLSAEDFYHHQNRVIFLAMESLMDDSQPIDIVTLSNELDKNKSLQDAGGQLGIISIQETVPTSQNALQYAKIVSDKSALRNLLKALDNGVDLAFNGDGEATDLIQEAVDNILRKTEIRSTSGFEKIKNVIGETLKKIEKNTETTSLVTGLATGFVDFDLATTGLHPGQLMILAARPAMGKTAFALNIAQNVGTKTTDTVAIFSLEMQATDLVQRMICAEGLVDSTHLRSGNLNDQEWESIIIASGALSRANIYLDDTSGIKINEIRAKCRKLKQERGEIGLIVIDYLQLIESSTRESRQQQISEISRQLKKLAMDFETPVIALSQLSRGVESRDDKRPELSDLRESGSIEQDADIVSFLYRDSYYRKESDEAVDEFDDDQTEIIIRKNRAGATKTVKVRFKGEYNRFDNYAPGYLDQMEAHLPS
ncbi:MAG: replicative DNA helicase [Streptococcaceae bacterium]|jgi:replicative DNA helicase|nr:replicative DNA helicase [Streptococcaceae bacterium]